MCLFVFWSEFFLWCLGNLITPNFCILAQRRQQRSGLIRDCDGDVHQSWPHCGHVCCRSGEAGPRTGTNLKLIFSYLQSTNKIYGARKNRSNKLWLQNSPPVRCLREIIETILKSVLGCLPKDVLQHNKMITESSLWSHRIDLSCISVFVFIFTCFYALGTEPMQISA